MDTTKDMIHRAKYLNDYNLVFNPDSQLHPMVMVVKLVGAEQTQLALKLELSCAKSIRDNLTELINAIEVVNEYREMPSGEESEEP